MRYVKVIRLYIGVGSSLGSGKYKGYGIIRRLLGHVLKADPVRKGSRNRVVRKKWSTVTRIYTIGFSQEYEYLAVSLEEYLIKKLSPNRNSSKSSR